MKTRGKLNLRPSRGFTLLELLVVIGIIGLLATLGIGALRGFSAVNQVAAGNRQLLDDLNMARNHALNQRSTVYVVFVPMLAKDFGSAPLGTNAAAMKAYTNRLGGQLTSYNFLTLRSPGDQPGKGRARYLGEWKHLPEGVYIQPDDKFFKETNAVVWMARAAIEDGIKMPMPRLSVPFPTSISPRVSLPCIAFNYRGELLGQDPTKPRNVDEYISLTRGSIIHGRDDKGALKIEIPELVETPRGNTTNNAFIRIDWVTGRARLQDRKEPKA